MLSAQEPASLSDSGPCVLNTTENTNHLEVSRDKLSIKYIGKGEKKKQCCILFVSSTQYSLGVHDHDVGAIRADQPLRMDRLISYFEVRVIDCGRKSALAVGLVDAVYSFMRHPGHESHSYGYHADDGKKYSDGKGEAYASTCKCSRIPGYYVDVRVVVCACVLCVVAVNYASTCAVYVYVWFHTLLVVFVRTRMLT